MKFNLKREKAMMIALILGVASTLSFNAVAGDTTVLNVGDRIPELKVGSWLKGTPVTSYEKGRLYIFEFWATWCGPCRQAMPHLSEVAAKYKDNITVVGIDIWENDENHHATTTPEKFVKMMGKNMAYNVATDTKDQWMGNHWMKAAGQEGIPCSFMVKDGIILWIGHPINLDSVIEVVNSGKYDPVAVKSEFKKKAERQVAQQAAMHRLIDPIDSAEKHGDWAKEFSLIDKVKKEMPDYAQYMNFRTFQVLLNHVSEDSAMSYTRHWQADDSAQFTGSTAVSIIQKEGLSKSSYMYAIELLKKVEARQPGGPTPLYQQLIAQAYAAAGDYANAVSTLQAAMDQCREGLSQGKWKGMMGEDTVEKMKKELAEYKAHLQ